jgi:hypothetical protein
MWRLSCFPLRNRLPLPAYIFGGTYVDPSRDRRVHCPSYQTFHVSSLLFRTTLRHLSCPLCTTARDKHDWSRLSLPPRLARPPRCKRPHTAPVTWCILFLWPLPYSIFSGVSTKWEAGRNEKRCAFECMGIHEVALQPRSNTKTARNRKTRHTAQRSTRVATTGETFAPAAKAVQPRTNLAATTPSPSLLCINAFLLAVILCNV